ncbi:MAG: class I SAM-dependent DNA methyltransferase [Ignavibacteriales bacterium]|nr:class I SAM-dependent DNA methyltransferase [Ignavibacteriales bacterium]
MPLSWNEIKQRAVKFSKDWEDVTEESAESQTFLNEFFEIFGVSRRRVSTFEKPVQKLDGREGYIDLLWPGKILIEHKSKGKNLEKATYQAIAYSFGLTEEELPQFILACDFDRFVLHDLEENTKHEFVLIELVKHVRLFSFIAGYQKSVTKDEDPVNIAAAELMGKLHDKLKAIGYTGHILEVYLVRLVFCLFADDTNIFNKGIFVEFIKLKTKDDGSDLAAQLASLFYILDTPSEERYKNLDETLAEFPFVNGKLFEEVLPHASFDSEMRNLLLNSCKLNWSKISPAIFGSLFQSVMNPEERRNLGAHYTSEKNILRVIKPLFLDELYKEFESVKNNTKQLKEFHKKLSNLKFLDPACGCGNFLVITYRELRLLEIEILKVLVKNSQLESDIKNIIWIDIDQFYGIEIEEWPARISEVAMWLIDHQMNMRVSEEFGEYFVRLPLKKTANIICDNALRIDWANIIVKNEIDITADVTNIIKISEPPPHYNTVNVYTKEVNVIDSSAEKKPVSVKTTFDYILGNPPFIGKHLQNAEQKKDIDKIFSGVKGAGVLDYVTCWYLKAARLIQNTNAKVAFVSTNSISQGEQPGVLWNVLFNLYGIKIHFAHRTFKWFNEAKGKAAVHVVIIGFANYDTNEKYLFEYENIKGEPHRINVKNVTPYLTEGRDLFILKKSKPISVVPFMKWGSKPVDDGYFLFTDEEKKRFLKLEPEAKDFIKPLVSANEFLNGQKRWCLWLKDIEPQKLRNLKLVCERVENVKNFRLASKKKPTQDSAKVPTLFAEIRQPDSNYIFIPLTTSENRKYIPLAFFTKDYIINNSASYIPKASKYHFGVLTSEMHMAWVKQVCGRLKSDYTYSNNIVYNNFPWPENPTDKQIKLVEEKAQKVLDTRKDFPNSSLADLYDPLTMPPSLVKAHQELDKAVDLCYRPQPFPNETKRIEYLFELYEKYTQPLLAEKKTKKKK